MKKLNHQLKQSSQVVSFRINNPETYNDNMWTIVCFVVGFCITIPFVAAFFAGNWN